MASSKDLMTDPQKTGEWLSKVLKDNNVLEHELAEMLDVSNARVCNWASGKRGMRLHHIMAICYLIIEKKPDYQKVRINSMKIYQELKGS